MAEPVDARGPQTPPPEPQSPSSSYVDKIKLRLPEKYPDLERACQKFSHALKAFEERINGFDSLKETLGEEELQQKYDRLSEEFIGFVLKTYKPKIEAGETRGYQLLGNLSVIYDLARSVRSPGALFLNELYSSHNPQTRINNLVGMEPEERAVRAVGLAMAARLNKHIYPDTHNMFRSDLEKAGITTPQGNPIDVAAKMLSDAQLIQAQPA